MDIDTDSSSVIFTAGTSLELGDKDGADKNHDKKKWVNLDSWPFSSFSSNQNFISSVIN